MFIFGGIEPQAIEKVLEYLEVEISRKDDDNNEVKFTREPFIARVKYDDEAHIMRSDYGSNRLVECPHHPQVGCEGTSDLDKTKSENASLVQIGGFYERFSENEYKKSS